jgi:cell division septal protein FtsQ
MATESKKPVKKTGTKNKDEMRAKKVAAKKRIEAKEKSKKKRSKILLFIVEIFVLLLMVVVLYGVLKTEKVGKVDIPEEDIVINEDTVR